MIDLPLVPPAPDPSEQVTVSVYDKATGAIRAVLSVPRGQLAANVPADCDHVAGEHDSLCRRVNPATRAVEAWQPPAPDADHVWDAATERWQLPPAILARNARRLRAQGAIDRLEQQSLRAMREHALGDATARARLQAIEAQIAALRPDLD